MSRTQPIITAQMYKALEGLSEQLNNALQAQQVSDISIMEKSGVSKYAFANIKRDRGFIPNMSTIIAIFDALGYKEITIRWRDPL